VLELVEIEVRELLQEFGYDANSTPIICGSALQTLNGDDGIYGRPAVLKLAETIDSYIKVPERNLTAPFKMPIESAMSVPGRGTVLIGTLAEGIMRVGDHADIKGFDRALSSQITDLQVFKKSVKEVKAGENVGVLVRSLKQDAIKRGMFLLAKDNNAPFTNFIEAQVYALQPSEGGRTKPIMTNYIQTMFVSLWHLDACIQLPEGTSMVMPGETLKVNVLLSRAMVITEGDKFTFRENSALTVSGIVTKILPMSKQVLPGFNFVIQKPVKISTANTAVTNKRAKAKKAK